MFTKALSVACALMAGSQAFRAENHPFVGEHHDADYVEYENGRSHRAEQVKVDFNKYDSILNKESRPMRKDGSRQVWEYIFGKSQEELDLEKKVADNQRAMRRSYGRGRLGQTVKLETDQYDRYGYAARFIMGGQSTMYALVDTATEVTAVASTNCTSCVSQDKYDPTNSIKDGIADVVNKTVTVPYGSGAFIGREAYDDICLVLGECLERMTYLLVDEQKDLQLSDDLNGISGIFGWARPNRPMQLNPSVTPEGDVFPFMLQSMQDQQFGSDFTTRFRRGYVSWIDVGGVSQRQMKGTPVTFSLSSDFFWSISTDGIKFGQDQADFFTWSTTEQGVWTYGETGLYTIFDISAPDIMISELWFDSVMEQLFTRVGKDYTIVNGTAQFVCNGTNFPDLFFSIEENYLEVPADEYVIDISAAQDKSLCGLLIRSINAPFNIMGLPAIEGYYVTHSFNNNTGDTMTFVPHKDSDRSELKANFIDGPSERQFVTKMESENVEGAQFIAVLVAVIVFAVIAGITVWLVLDASSTNSADGMTISIVAGAGALIAIICFFITRWIMMAILNPGNVVWPVTPADQAVKQVSATNLGIFSLITYALYKLFGKKKVEKKEVVAEETSAEAEVDELINSIE